MKMLGTVILIFEGFGSESVKAVSLNAILAVVVSNWNTHSPRIFPLKTFWSPLLLLPFLQVPICEIRWFYDHKEESQNSRKI